MLKNLIFGGLLVLLFSVTASGASFTDAMDRQISLPHTPERIVSLVPSVTEILFKLGLEKHIVAVTDFCTYPEEAQKLPKVGNYSDPSLESILLHKPDLIIAAADMNRPALVRRLELLQIPVYVVYPQTIAATLETIQDLGKITGAEEQSRQLVNSIEMRIQRIQQKISSSERPTTLECVLLQPLTVAGPDTFVADIITIAGGQNVVPKGPSRYPTWNIEALLTVDPETIIVSSYSGQPDPKHYFDRWPQLRAVQNQRIINIDADWIHRPGPRMILGIETLAQALHPGIFFND